MTEQQPNGRPEEGNIALLIDADNASPQSIDPVLTVLAEFGTVNVRRVYGNWNKPALKRWGELTVRLGLEPFQQFDLTKGKNATDMRMTIDAMDLLHRGRITGFGLMSSDSDFTPLATRIRQEGVAVYGFGTDKTPIAFQTACTRFIDASALVRAAEAAADPAPQPVPIARPTAKNAIDADLLKLLVDAYKAAAKDANGFASLSAVGQLAGNRSSFDTRNYGFARLSDLIQAVPNFQIERREGGRVYVKRVR